MEREISIHTGIFPGSFKIFICGRNEKKLLKMKFSKHSELVEHYIKNFGINKYLTVMFFDSSTAKIFIEIKK
jgi:hypothetical protein